MNTKQSATKRRILLPLFLALIALSPAPALADEAPRKGSPQPGTCAEPVVSRDYTPEAMTYRVTVDLHGCDWWDGSPLSLVAVLSRDDGKTEDFTFSPVGCTASIGEDDEDGRFDIVGCEAVATLEHPVIEVAHYRGAVSWIWQDGDHTAGFGTTCVSSATTTACRDDHAPAVRAPGVHT